MTGDWSRRALLASLAAGLAGCTTDGGTATERETPSPTEIARETPTPPPDGTPPSDDEPSPREPRTPDEVERLSADHPALSWAVRLPDDVVSPPAIDPERGRVYVSADGRYAGTPTDETSDQGGRVFSLRTADGREAWRVETDETVVHRPVVHDGRVHVVTGYWAGIVGRDQRIVAFGLGGEERWRTPARDDHHSIVAAHNGTLFVDTPDDYLAGEGESLFTVDGIGEVGWEREASDAMGGTFTDGTLLYDTAVGLDAYDPATGDRRWHLSGDTVSSPSASVAAFGGRCFVESDEETTGGSVLAAHSVADGSELWRYAGPESEGDFSPTGVADLTPALGEEADTALVGTGSGGTVFALRGDGREAWTATTDAGASGPVVGDAVYVGDGQGTVYALDPEDGDERWRASMPASVRLRPLADGVLAQAATERGDVLAAFSADGRERWRYETERDLHVPLVAGDRVYVTADDAVVLAFGEKGE